LFFEIAEAMGTTRRTIRIPMTPGQPILSTRIIVTPIIVIGKLSPLRKRLNLISNTPKSLDNKLVIFPSSEDLMTYAVSLDIFPYKRIIRAAFILVAIS